MGKKPLQDLSDKEIRGLIQSARQEHKRNNRWRLALGLLLALGCIGIGTMLLYSGLNQEDISIKPPFPEKTEEVNFPK